MTLEELRLTCKKEEDLIKPSTEHKPLGRDSTTPSKAGKHSWIDLGALGNREEIMEIADKALVLLDEWKDLWELIKGKHLRDLMSADLYRAAVTLHVSTKKLLKDSLLNEMVNDEDEALICHLVSEDMRQTVEDIRVEMKKP